MGQRLNEESKVKRFGLYGIVAKVIRQCCEDVTPAEVDGLRRFAFCFVDAVHQTDKDFNGQRFLNAAGFGESKPAKLPPVAVETIW
jgi:hypothetical protein